MKKTQFIPCNYIRCFADELLKDQILIVTRGRSEAVLPYSEQNLSKNCDIP